jgi:MFS family permease
VGNRKKTICFFVFLHAVMLVPMILTPFLFKGNPVIFLILFFTLYTGFNTLVGPVWSDLMCEYVPARKRGSYFGWRNKIMSIVVIGASLTAGIILQAFGQKSLAGFAVILSIALACRLVSIYFLTRMYEPRFTVHRGAYFSIIDFIRTMRHSNFGRFVLFIAGMQFCVNLAAPFFSVFMLRDLQFSYITYTVLVATVTAVQIFTMGRWGRCADRTGTLKVLKVTALVIATLPLWWLVSRNPAYLFFIQILGGFVWSGFNLCTTNFVYDAVTPQKRIRCLGYLNVFVGMAVFLGGLIGGQLATIMPPVLGYKLLSLFCISSILRFLVLWLIVGTIKEVRPIEKMKTKDMLWGVAGLARLDA